MQLELKRLALRHGASLDPGIIPLTAPDDNDDCRGLAATDIDRVHMQFRPWCFSFKP
jgi:hypothetical protein